MRYTEYHYGVAVIKYKNKHKETMERLAELEERDTPKRPIKSRDSKEFHSMDVYKCPTCGKLFSGTGIAKFCYHCGQRLDWDNKNPIKDLNAQLYIEKYEEKWDKCCSEAKLECDFRNGELNTRATEIFEESATADEIVGFYLFFHKDDAFLRWAENTKGIPFSNKDKEIDKKLRKLFHIEQTSVNLREITNQEFHALQPGNTVFVKIGEDLYPSKVISAPFYNADAEEPDWEVETTNGFCDEYSLYVSIL